GLNCSARESGPRHASRVDPLPLAPTKTHACPVVASRLLDGGAPGIKLVFGEWFVEDCIDPGVYEAEGSLDRRYRRQARHWFPPLGNDDLLALRNALEQSREMRLGDVDINGFWHT